MRAHFTTMALCLFALAVTAQQSCNTMFSSLQCRTTSEDPSQIDGNAITNARKWLCNGYPQFCNAINTGGMYSSCNAAEQISYAMNLYYAAYQGSQGPQACSFGGLGQVVSAAVPSCQTMFSSLQCRTKSEDPSTLSTNDLNNARIWLCNNHPQYCSDIVNGGKYSTCNPAEQLSYAMNLYYGVYGPSQGTSACSFGGLGVLASGSNTPAPATPTPTPTPAPAQPSPDVTATCTAMWNGLTCRTASTDATTGVAGARSWLCGAYSNMCTQIQSGGNYAGCTPAVQLSYAMDQYYKQFSYLGASACYFGGVAQIVGAVAPAAAPVAAPAPAPVSAPSGAKAGLAWPIDQFHDGSNPSLGPWAQGQISWIYTWNWDFAPLNIQSTNLEWVPMLHSGGDIGNFLNQINSGAFDNVKNVLLFNEPDLNYPPYAYALDVATAITATKQVFQAMRARGKAWRIGTPAMSYNQGWLQQYMSGMAAQCPDCKFSFVPVHCYTLDVNNFMSTVQSYHTAFGLPVWVTEYADTDFSGRNWQVGLSDVQKFMDTSTKWMNAQSWVERYSWFGVMRAVDIQDKANIAMNMDGSRNALGDQYVLRGGSL